jgi:hypothetical protein
MKRFCAMIHLLPSNMHHNETSMWLECSTHKIIHYIAPNNFLQTTRFDFFTNEGIILQKIKFSINSFELNKANSKSFKQFSTSFLNNYKWAENYEVVDKYIPCVCVTTMFGQVSCIFKELHCIFLETNQH